MTSDCRAGVPGPEIDKRPNALSDDIDEYRTW